MKRKIFIAAFLAAVSLAGFAKGGKNANVFDLKHNITDSEIVYPGVLRLTPIRCLKDGL